MACAPLMLSMLLPSVGWANSASSTTKASKVTSVSKVEVVTGTVKDKKGEALIGVAVKIKGAATGTTTDVNGNFKLNLPTGNETLVITYVGFERQEIAVAGRKQLSVVLVESTNQLADVVVNTGYGSKKRSEVVGSVASITGEQIQDIPAPSIAGALRNQIAGVGVSQVSGRPGSSITLNIRNATTSETGASIGATAEPLIIIDGITMPPGDDTFNTLDPSMVESISFLKDASAAIYGAAGAKGVVLVTTKKGKQGKPSITYNGYLGVTNAARTPDMMSAYGLAALINDGLKAKGTAQASDFFSADDLEYIKNLKNNSWYDELWSASTMQRHNISVSGGSDRITFFVGGSFQGQDGNYAGLKNDKYSFRSGVTAKIIEGLNAELNFNVDNNIRRTTSGATENDATFFQYVITTPQWVPITIDGKYVNIGSGRVNPLAILNSGYYSETRSKGYRINASLNYQPSFLKGFSAKLQISPAGTSNRGRQYRPPYTTYSFSPMGNNKSFYSNQVLAGDGGVTTANAQTVPSFADGNSYQGFATLKYANTFGHHSVDVTVGGEQSETYSEDLSIYFRNQLIPGSSDWWAFEKSSLTFQNNTINENHKRSFFGRFSYDWDKKYLIEGVARLDASSNFATGNRWGLSPSIGLGWVVSKEDFFKKNVPFVNFLKLKANYGITGDDRVSSRLWQERYLIDGAGNGYLFGDNNDGLGINISAFPNLLITWEKKKTFNAGLEASLLNNKIDIGIEFFRNKTYDGFDKGASETYPFYGGFMAPIVNYREYYNWGSEFTIGYKAKLAKDLNLNTNINFGYGNSVLDQMIYPISDAISENPNNGKWLATRVGTDPRTYTTENVGLRNLGMFRTQAEVDEFLAGNPNYKIYGQTPQPGWLKYEDTNGDGIVNDYDMGIMFGKITPFFSSGISFDLTYKNLSLRTNIAARFGGKVFYDGRARTAPSLSTVTTTVGSTVTEGKFINNVVNIWEDHWSLDNPNGKYPRFDDPSITKNSDFWAVDGTTIRVNNMTLSYKLPAKMAQRLGLGGARLLATGDNLWTIVNPLSYKDPYTSSAYDYPTLRTISLGLSVNF